MTPIGTITHEFSHYVVSRYLGLKPIFHYNGISFEKETLFYLENLNNINTRLFYYSTVAGPLQTIIIGLLGFFFSFKRYNRIGRENINALDWIYIYMTFFLLRQIYIFLKELYCHLKNSPFLQGDECFISYYLGLPLYSISLMIGVPSIIICTVTIFKIVPSIYRTNLLLGLFFGSILGYFLWFNIIGVLVFP